MPCSTHKYRTASCETINIICYEKKENYTKKVVWKVENNEEIIISHMDAKILTFKKLICTNSLS